MSATRKVILGRLPVFCGKWTEGRSYYRFNKVTFYDSEFTSTKDNNTTPPATVTMDSSSAMQGYVVNDGWVMSSNSYDASIYLKNIVNEIDRTYNFTPGYVVIEDSSIVNPLYKYLKYSAQTLTLAEQQQARRNIGASEVVGVSQNTDIGGYDIIIGDKKQASVLGEESIQLLKPELIQEINESVSQISLCASIGTTVNRPAFSDIPDGFLYFDTDENKLLINNDSAWVDVNGIPV